MGPVTVTTDYLHRAVSTADTPVHFCKQPNPLFHAVDFHVVFSKAVATGIYGLSEGLQADGVGHPFTVAGH